MVAGSGSGTPTYTASLPHSTGVLGDGRVVGLLGGFLSATS